MTKEEKIKEAYIEVFGEKRIRSIMNYVYKENGFIVGFVLLDLKLDIKSEKLERKFNGVVYSYRPKSLHGIENNNGWIKIESEKDLPERGYYEVIERATGKPLRASLNNEFGTLILVHYYSHYQPIIDIDLPLY